MRIKINKDIETAYQNEAFKGFTLRQILHLVLGIVVMGVVAFLLWRKAGLSPDISIYAGLPFGIPIVVCGFVNIQGLTLFEYLKEMHYARQTKILTYDAGELPEDCFVFSTESEKRKGKKG